MLFLLALCGVYALRDWRTVLWLVTAFTIGHSLTLALTALDFLHVKSSLVEFLIPLTIFLTAVGNLWLQPRFEQRRNWPRYGAALTFGLVHGMGFSSYFQSLLGDAGQVIHPLLFFNLGVEAGQCLIVLCFLGLGWLSTTVGIPQKGWRIGISVFAAAVALVLMVNRF